MNTENTNQDELSIPPRAGLLRGVRLLPDPDGILSSPFEEQGQKLGYLFVYGEEEPAVFDGTVWHPILESPKPWSSMQDEIAAQYYKIVQHTKKNSYYDQLAIYINGSDAGTA
jgi:hypothetical protein